MRWIIRTLSTYASYLVSQLPNQSPSQLPNRRGLTKWLALNLTGWIRGRAALDNDDT